MRTESSRNSTGYGFILVLILAAILVFYLYSESEFLGYTVLTLSASLGVIEIFKSIRSASNSALANGNVWVLASLLLIFVVSPIVRVATNSQLPLVFARRDTDTNMDQVNVLASIAILGVILGSRMYVKVLNVRASNIDASTNKTFRPSMILSILLFTFWIVLYLYWATSQGNPFTAIFGTRSSQRTFGVVKSNGYLVDSLYGALGVITAWLAYSVHDNNKRLTKKLLGASLMFVIPSFLQGDRSKSIFFIVVISIILTGWKAKLNKSYVLIAVLLIPILVVAPRVFRQSQDNLSSIGNVAFSITNITETLTKEDTAMAPTLSILLDNLGTSIPYQYGKSYINLVAKPVPRALWPGKPIEFDTQMMRILFPTYAASGVGFAFSAISEPLVNFGLIGVVIFFTGIGILNRRNLDRLINNKTSLSIFTNAWLAGFMFVLIRGNLSVDFQRAVFPLASGLFVLYFHGARKRI